MGGREISQALGLVQKALGDEALGSWNTGGRRRRWRRRWRGRRILGAGREEKGRGEEKGPKEQALHGLHYTPHPQAPP
ncbi:hypothetical protein TthAA37_08180 [Thermus thermophilus]|nr:hypothetical protein TthAA37_08180 [Thermus thermophilus]BDG23588.1 hypothetical protein TthSNM33_07820 [Thermus thermophilus]